MTEGNLLQLTTGDRVTATMDPDAPPGFGLTMDPAIGNLSRRRPESPIPATRRADGETGSGGGACLIQYSASTPTLPDVTSVRTQAAPSADDSDVFSFLAGMRPRDHVEESPTLYSTATPGRGVAPESAGSPSNSRETELSQSAGRSGPSTFPSMSVVSPAPVTTPSMGELNMILKTLQTLVPEFPKLDPGDPSTRARRFQQWLLQVTQSLEPAGSHVTAWWSWVRTTAEHAHRVMTTRPVDQRENIIPREAVPPQFLQIESWLRPRILACIPKTQREWVDLRAQQGVVDPSNVLLFYTYKFFAPGSPDERDGLMRRVLNPSVCTHAGSAQIEHIRWRADIRRLSALGCYPPDLMLSYRALESIFSSVFDRAEPQLNLRWNMLKNRLGLPHVITPQALTEVSRFADTELSALVILGGSSLNPGLPLTENQKARQQQIKETDKKRAAAAKTQGSSRLRHAS